MSPTDDTPEDRATYTGAEVAATRHLLGLSQAELAAAVGVSRQTLNDWMSGKFSPSGDAGQRLAAVRAEHDREAARLIQGAADGVIIALPDGPKPRRWYLALGARVLAAEPDAMLDWA